MSDCRFDSLIDTALDRQRIASGCNVLQTFADNCLGKNGSGRGTVTGHVIGL